MSPDHFRAILAVVVLIGGTIILRRQLAAMNPAQRVKARKYIFLGILAAAAVTSVLALLLLQPVVP